MLEFGKLHLNLAICKVDAFVFKWHAFPIYKTELGAGEMAQQLRAGTVLAEGPEFASQHPHLAAHNHLQLQLQGNQRPLLASSVSCTHVHMPTHRHICIHIIKNKIFQIKIVITSTLKNPCETRGGGVKHM